MKRPQNMQCQNVAKPPLYVYVQFGFHPMYLKINQEEIILLISMVKIRKFKLIKKSPIPILQIVYTYNENGQNHFPFWNISILL